ALDLAAAYFQSGRSRRALIVAAEHNSLYSSDSDERSGHLWGDGAGAVVVDIKPAARNLELFDIHTVGLADRGRGPKGITMAPCDGGLVMHHGKDIFAHACREMASSARALLARHQLTSADLRLVVPHQANKRIIDAVAEDLGLSPRQ